MSRKDNRVHSINIVLQKDPPTVHNYRNPSLESCSLTKWFIWLLNSEMIKFTKFYIMDLYNSFSKFCSLHFILSNDTNLLTQIEASNLAFITIKIITHHKKTLLILKFSDFALPIHTLQTFQFPPISHFSPRACVLQNLDSKFGLW